MRVRGEPRIREEWFPSRLGTLLAAGALMVLPHGGVEIGLAWTANAEKVDRNGDPLPVGAVQRLGTLRYRHFDRPTAFALSPDGQRAAMGGFGGIAVFETRTGTRRVLSEGCAWHDSDRRSWAVPVAMLAFSPDGRTLAAILQHGQCRAWSLSTGEERPLVRPNGTEDVRHMTFTEVGELLVVVKSGDRLRVVDLDTGTDRGAVSLGDSDREGTRPVLSRDGSLLLLAFPREFAPDAATLWNVETGERLSHQSIGRTLPLLGFTSNGIPVAVYSRIDLSTPGHFSNHIRLVDVRSGEILQEVVEKPEDDGFDTKRFDVNCIGIAGNVDLIATASFRVGRYGQRSGSASFRVRNLATGKELLQANVPEGLAGNAEFSLDGKVVALWGGNNEPHFQSFRLWDLPGGRRLDHCVGHEAPVRSLAFSPNGRTLASASVDGAVKLWDLADAEPIIAPTDSISNGNCVVFSPDGRLLAATCAGPFETSRVVVWDAATAVPRYWLPVARMETAASIAFSRDGKRMATGAIAYAGGYMLTENPNDPPRSFGTIEVWECNELASYPYSREQFPWDTRARDFQRRGALSKCEDTSASVAFSPDGTALATGGWHMAVQSFGHGYIRLWQLPEGRLTREIGPLHWAVGETVFSPDGRLLAAVSGKVNRSEIPRDKGIHLWNPQDGSAVGEMAGHEAAVVTVAFSPDGRHLASGSLDKTARIWDVASRTLLATLRGHDSAVLCVAFSPNGELLATGSQDTTILLWDISAARTGCSAPN